MIAPRIILAGEKRATTVQSIFSGLLLLAIAMLPAVLAHAQPASEEVLRTADAVRRLTPKQAAKHMPVRFTAVVTFHDGAVYSRFVQDETSGIYLQETTNMPPFGPGQLVEVDGVTGAGEYAPIVMLKSIKVVGKGELPKAKPVSLEELVSGREDSQYVEVVGTVRSVRFEQESEYYLVDMVMGGERFTAYTRQLPVTNTQDLIESVVRVRGVCSSLFNRQRQLFGFRLLVPREADLMIEKPAAANPFDIQTQEISSLLGFTAQSTFGRRVKVAGTVVYQEPGVALFIQDEKEGLRCQTRERLPVQVGDYVEVLGFPAKGEYTPVLQDATFRKIRAGSATEPVKITLDEALAGTHDCKLVRITGKLLEHTQRGREQFIVLENNGFIFYGYLAKNESSTGFSQVQVGSEIAVAGICLIERGSSWLAGEGWRAKGFRILLRSPEDVVILRSPPWLNVRRVLWLAAALGFLALAASGWVAVLHRQVAERTRQLGKQIQERQLAERQREIEQERARVAHDLHDDLGAGLTEVNMLSSLVKSSTTSEEEKQRYLDELMKTAERMVTSLDEIVWAVNPRNDTVVSLASYFASYAQRLLELASISCGLDVAEDLPDHPLDPKFRQELFFAFKEALNNVVRHSGATQVWLRISVQEDHLTVVLADNGHGFDSHERLAGADGITNMKERLEALHGECEILSDAPRGTNVRFRAPLPRRLV
ncbi:MAG: sensor histidine kinase [Verrucomicrobia bacterium]|nr:sensor histidine kinase [Verrucomicrobiota bacterium]